MFQTCPGGCTDFEPFVQLVCSPGTACPLLALLHDHRSLALVAAPAGNARPGSSTGFEPFVQLVRDQLRAIDRCRGWAERQLPGPLLNKHLQKSALTVSELGVVLATFRCGRGVGWGVCTPHTLGNVGCTWCDSDASAFMFAAKSGCCVRQKGVERLNGAEWLGGSCRAFVDLNGELAGAT
eukprot:343875-Chlamydomonas_euryale.AAC.3